MIVPKYSPPFFIISVVAAVDKWKNARIENPDAETETIAAIAFPDAGGAMFLTTITTAIAFFGTAICPVAPVSVLVEYLSIILSGSHLTLFVVFCRSKCLQSFAVC